MVYYLNFGFILEQALADLIRRYIDRQNFDEVYGNFHISVMNEHPFAHMIIDSSSRCADNFPSIIVTTQSDSKTGEMAELPLQTYEVGYTSEEIDCLVSAGFRNKKRLLSGGKAVDIVKNGVLQKERVPGFILVYDKKSVEELKRTADSRSKDGEKGMVYGLKINTRKTDLVSIEIWAENNELKNELYEHVRLFLSGALPRLLEDEYRIFEPALFDKTITGERSANYNFDFDSLLCGSHLSFEVDYDIAQVILDTELENINGEIVPEVINHVKNEN